MLKYTNRRFVDIFDWDKLVSETYGRVYSFQQQDGCKPRGIVNITIPDESYDDEMNDSVPEVVNGDIMGVKFSVWLARDPKQPIKGQRHDFELDLFWERNFYPEFQAVANDLFEKGLIEAGDYVIDIDW
jgi:hypothetical protein